MNNAYGYCPRCGGLGMSRECRLNGNDCCENGRSYPSVSAVANPLLPVASATERTAEDERAAVVAWLREQALQAHPDAAGWFALNHVSVMIERGEHRRGEEA